METGKTVSDFTDEEIARRISIHASLSHLAWKDRKVNILDTPGSADFVGEVIAALRVAEVALLAVGADVGVQIETIKLWRRLARTEMPRFVFVNKMEKERADFDKVVADLKEKFKAAFVPVTIPIGAAADFKGVIDLVDGKAYLDGGSRGRSRLREGRVRGGPGDPDGGRGRRRRQADRKVLRRGHPDLRRDPPRAWPRVMRAGKLVPVLCGAALTGAGVASLLDFIAWACPSPAGEAKGLAADGTEVTRKVAEDGPASLFVFKTALDQFTGKISYFKVMSGRVATDTDLVSAREGKKEKFSKLYTCLGKRIEDATEFSAGDLGMFTKSATLHTNDTLHSPDAFIRWPDLEMPTPVHSLAIEAKAKKDEDKMNQTLQRTMEEDLTFRVAFEKETRQMLISGMGELHIQMILERIKEHQKIEVETHVPKVAYRETIQGKGDAEYTHKKQTGGHGQFARVALEVQALHRGEQYKFTNAIFGGAISKSYIPAVEKGVVEAMEAGVLAGYPVVDVEARVVDGKEHAVDSSELAFKLAAREAFRESMRKAKPVLLEPVSNLTVYIDDQYLGDVLSDLSGKRGKVLGQNPIGGGIQEIKAQVPQAELLRYAIDLKALTSGTGSFELEFDHYSPISGRIADDVIKAAQAAKAEAE